jgi:hypothetical protein
MPAITMENVADDVADEGPEAARDATAKNVVTAMIEVTTGAIAKTVATDVTPEEKTTDRVDRPSTFLHASALRSSSTLRN